MREMDLVLGKFADAQIVALSDADLDEYEPLARVPARKSYWVNGSEPVPPEYDTALFRRLRDFITASQPVHDPEKWAPVFGQESCTSKLVARWRSLPPMR